MRGFIIVGRILRETFRGDGFLNLFHKSYVLSVGKLSFGVENLFD